MIDITEIVKKYKSVAFTFASIKGFECLLDISNSQGVIFSRFGYVEEDIFEKYTKYLHKDHACIILLVHSIFEDELDYYRIYCKPGIKDEIQIYSRSYKDYDNYEDWDKYKFIDFMQLIRDDKLDRLGI